ncbi:hypothetical protein [Mongoliitalea daihaiensis]|uniref:hypothetical protein n=1 Tax=Mongoliitalea daihaiensis TaxID=2782006 RepID=UPI001F46A66E|nr:hypothetical protein [Mongoliitalea daihaiensis]UJP65720.1 hypothetical protein IPZ59_03590 [Mongoliitalea daihaiensis]
MKKLNLFAALLFSGSVAIAQSNDANVSQEGNNHQATVVQTGSQNSSSVAITGGSGSEVEVTQIGANNTASFLGRQNVQGLQYQEGDRNFASAGQGSQVFAGGSIIEQIQIGNDNRATTAHWTQPTNIRVYQTQIGDRNTADARRLRGFNITEITQTQVGNDNTALLNPTGSSQYYADGGFVRQLQTGDYNYASINRAQGAGSIGGTFIQEQVGNLNRSTINSTRNTILGETIQIGDENVALINQFDRDNSAAIRQQGDENFGSISQTGSDNRASQWVAGSFNEVTQIQNGNLNNQRIEITGSSNTYMASQVGDRNFIYVNSRGTGPGLNSLTANNSEFMASQNGDRNTISGAMGGDNNSLTINQYGDANIVNAGASNFAAEGFLIQGNNNVGIINQFGNGNSATLNMVGNGNSATITQSAFPLR